VRHRHASLCHEFRAPLHAEAGIGRSVCIASWILILSATLIGRIADRNGRHVTVLYLRMAAAMASLLLLRHAEKSLVLSPAFLLFGMKPAGIIMALTAQSIPP